MRYFSSEDNANLYNSNLSEKFKNYIANFNEIIMLYMYEKFGTYEGFNEFLEHIKKRFRKVTYEVNNEINANACFSHNDTTKEYKFQINEKTLKMYSIEQGLIAIYFHEFSHFISHMCKAKIGTRLEEAVADLFSDELIEYFNKIYANQNLVEFKPSAYENSASILRNIFVLNKCSETEFLWNYYNNDENKLFKIFENAYGTDTAKLIFDIEKNVDNSRFISDEEVKNIKQSLNNIEIENVDLKHIKNNSIFNEIIYEKTKSLSILEIKEKYPNIPDDFFNEYSVMYSNVNIKKQNILNKESLNEEEIDDYVNTFLEKIQIDKYQNPNIKTGLYKDYVIDTMLDFLKVSKIYKLDLMLLVPCFYSYELIYNNKPYSSDNLVKELKSMGFDEYFEEKIVECVTSKSKVFYDYLSKYNNQEMFEELKRLFKKSITDSVISEQLIKQLESKTININQFIDESVNFYNNSKIENIYEPTIYIISVIKQYVKYISLNQKLNLSIFKNVKEELEGKLDIPGEINLTKLILTEWNIKNVSIYDVVEIVSMYGIEKSTSSSVFENIRVKGIIEVKNEQNINNVLRYIKATTSKIYKDSISFYQSYLNRRVVDITPSSKKINENIYAFIKEKMLNKDKTLLELFKNYDTDLINFYRYRYYNELDSSDIEFLKATFKDSDKEKPNLSDFISYELGYAYIFRDEVYDKLKERPHLALAYIANYLPSDSYSLVNLYYTIDKLKKIKNDFLKKTYTQTINDITINIINNGITIDERDIKWYDIEYEINLLALNYDGILDEQIKNQLLVKLLEISKQKLNKIFIDGFETFDSKDKTKEKIINKISEVENKISDEGAKSILLDLKETVLEYVVSKKL